MERRRKFIFALLTCVVLLSISILAALLWQPVSIDLSKEEEPFRSLKLPLQYLAVSRIMSHDSYALLIKDHDGREVRIDLSYINGVSQPYHEASAAYGWRNPASITLKDSKRARKVALYLLRASENQPILVNKRTAEGADELRYSVDGLMFQGYSPREKMDRMMNLLR